MSSLEQLERTVSSLRMAGRVVSVPVIKEIKPLSWQDGKLVPSVINLMTEVDGTFFTSGRFPYMTKLDWALYNSVMLGPGRHFLGFDCGTDDILMRRMISFRHLKEDFRALGINLIRVNYWLAAIVSELVVRGVPSGILLIDTNY
jgi:hypothetical protein